LFNEPIINLKGAIFKQRKNHLYEDKEEGTKIFRTHEVDSSKVKLLKEKLNSKRKDGSLIGERSDKQMNGCFSETKLRDKNNLEGSEKITLLKKLLRKNTTLKQLREISMKSKADKPIMNLNGNLLKHNQKQLSSAQDEYFQVKKKGRKQVSKEIRTNELIRLMTVNNLHKKENTQLSLRQLSSRVDSEEYFPTSLSIKYLYVRHCRRKFNFKLKASKPVIRLKALLNKD